MRLIIEQKNVTSFIGTKIDDPELSICEWGHESCKKGKQWIGHTSYCLIHYIYSGKGCFSVKGKVYEVSKGDLFLTPYDTDYSTLADSETPFKYYWLGLMGVKVQTLLKGAGLDGRESLAIKVKNPTSIQKRLKEIVYSKSDELSSYCKMMGNLYLFFYELMGEQPKSGKELSMDTYIRNATQYILNHYQDNVTVLELANVVCLERTYFSRIFKEKMGCSPKRYILNLQIEKAVELIKTTDLPISEISAKVGFNDVGVFIKAFKNRIHLCPSEYLELYSD